MKQLVTALAIISAILATILAVLPKFNLAIYPAILALLAGGAAYYMSKKEGELQKIVPFTIYLSSIALCIVIFKFISTARTAVPNTTSAKDTPVKIKEEHQ